MKTFLLLFMALSFSHSDENVIQLSDFNTCNNLLSYKSKGTMRTSHDFVIYNLYIEAPPEYIEPSDFFNEAITKQELFFFKGELGPFFGAKGPENWRPIQRAHFDFTTPIDILVREESEDGVKRFTRYSRFKLKEAALAFAEIFQSFKVHTGTVSMDYGDDYLNVFAAQTQKEQMVALINSWGISPERGLVEDFKERVTRIINNPEFDLSDARSVRFYFAAIIDLFKESFGKHTGYEHRYQAMLDELEKKGLLQYLIIYSLD